MKAPDKIYIYKHRYYENQFDIEWGEDRIHDDDIEYTRSDLIPTWQPIETAPKNGTLVLVFSVTATLIQDSISIRYWNKDKEKWALPFNAHNVVVLSFHEPTHWMPLPKGPIEVSR